METTPAKKTSRQKIIEHRIREHGTACVLWEGLDPAGIADLAVLLDNQDAYRQTAKSVPTGDAGEIHAKMNGWLQLVMAEQFYKTLRKAGLFAIRPMVEPIETMGLSDGVEIFLLAESRPHPGTWRSGRLDVFDLRKPINWYQADQEQAVKLARAAAVSAINEILLDMARTTSIQTSSRPSDFVCNVGAAVDRHVGCLSVMGRPHPAWVVVGADQAVNLVGEKAVQATPFDGPVGTITTPTGPLDVVIGSYHASRDMVFGSAGYVYAPYLPFQAICGDNSEIKFNAWDCLKNTNPDAFSVLRIVA